MQRTFQVKYYLPRSILEKLSWQNTYTTIQIIGLPTNITKHDLEQLYSQFGSIKRSSYVQKNQNNYALGYVVYKNILFALKAIALTDDTYQFGSARKITVYLLNQLQDQYFQEMRKEKRYKQEQSQQESHDENSVPNINIDPLQKLLIKAKQQNMSSPAKIPKIVFENDKWIVKSFKNDYKPNKSKSLKGKINGKQVYKPQQIQNREKIKKINYQYIKITNFSIQSDEEDT